LRKRVEAVDSDVPDNELIELVLRDEGLKYIHKRAEVLYEAIKGLIYGSKYVRKANCTAVCREVE
jgi:hypothetical protein